MTTVNKKFDRSQFFWQKAFMNRPVQKRTLETRARLIAAAEAIIDETGYEALRVEEVVLRAGTAKGTFFAHFKDKDALMDLIIGGKIDEYLDQQSQKAPPKTVNEIIERLMPVCEFMSCERYVFDLIFRYSGAASIEEIGVIATTFGRQIEILEKWITECRFRSDITVELVAEGVHAFMLQAIAVRFCALHNSVAVKDRLGLYLDAWLNPAV